MPPIKHFSDLDLNGSYTYADYLTWQFTEWVELIRGKVAKMSAPLDVHQQVATNLTGLLYAYLRRRPCRLRAAPYDVRLTSRGPNATDDVVRTVVQPDLCVICDRSKIDMRGCNGAPDWIIEILSPGTASRDWKAKFDLYEENGVGEYWIVAPGEQNISVFVLDAATGRYQTIGDYAAPGPVPSATLSELIIDWTDIFEDYPPVV